MRHAGLLLVVAAAGCSQPLAGGIQGAGGTGATGGKGAPSDCSTLPQQYETALSEARMCDPKASGQCQKVADEALSICGSCQINVNDDTQLAAFEQRWHDLGCDQPPNTPPCRISCQTAVTDVCVAGPTGLGTCSAAPVVATIDAGVDASVAHAGADAGFDAAAADAGLADCGAVSAAYTAALFDAMRCDPGSSTAPCTQPVSSTLDSCVDCTTYVTDATVLRSLSKQWIALGCADGPMDCPIWYCDPAVGGMCASVDGGAPTCQTIYATVMP